MSTASTFETMTFLHMVAMPYPGRGHINPMMNLCKLITSQSKQIIITFVVTEEWLGHIGSETKPANIRFITIPNVLPSELVRGTNKEEFIEAILTKMEEPFQRVLEQLEVAPTIIVADAFLPWAVSVGNRRNIPVASFWPMAAVVFSVFYHFDLLIQHGHFPVELSEKGNELVDYIPGISSIHVADLPGIINGRERKFVPAALSLISWASKAQHFLLNSVYEIEAQVIDSLKAKFPVPIYTLGPAIPHSKVNDNFLSHNDLDYSKWLNSQPTSSVLYISLGSFLSVSSAQMEELGAGLRDSGVRYLWVARDEASKLKEACGEMGLVVPWCDQLSVLCHSSVGGFWSHCGWNSTIEAVFAGVPLLAFPISMDQFPNSKMIVEDWKIGWRVRREVGMEQLVKRDEISRLVQKFMNSECAEKQEMIERARALQEICGREFVSGGLFETCLNAFMRDVFQHHDQ